MAKAANRSVSADRRTQFKEIEIRVTVIRVEPKPDNYIAHKVTIMTRILMVATIAGTLKGFIAPIANHFRAKGYRVDAMANGLLQSLVCRDSFDHLINIHWTRKVFDPGNFLLLLYIRKIIVSRRYDIVHVHTPIAAFIVRMALGMVGYRHNIKVIYTAHGFHFCDGNRKIVNSLFILLEKIAGRWTDYLVVINRDDYHAAKAHRIVPTERICYMPGIGIDTNLYSVQNIDLAAVSNLRKEFGIDTNSKLFLMVAEFTANKCHSDAIMAFSKLTQANVHLAFAGTGPLFTAMKDLASLLKIEDRVHFLGYRNDIPELIYMSNATMLVSRREGLPRSVMESLCLETPVIGTHIRGVKELLAGGCGILVSPGNIDQMTKAMQCIIEDEKEAKRMGKTGCYRMEKYDIENILLMHSQLYGRALRR